MRNKSMFLLYQIWTPPHQVLTGENLAPYSEKLYLGFSDDETIKTITFTTDPEKACKIKTEEEAKDCTTWLSRKNQWYTEKYQTPKIEEGTKDVKS